MAETYIVKITTQAQGQMKEIMHYIASELKAPQLKDTGGQFCVNYLSN